MNVGRNECRSVGLAPCAAQRRREETATLGVGGCLCQRAGSAGVDTTLRSASDSVAMEEEEDTNIVEYEISIRIPFRIQASNDTLEGPKPEAPAV